MKKTIQADIRMTPGKLLVNVICITIFVGSLVFAIALNLYNHNLEAAFAYGVATIWASLFMVDHAINKATINVLKNLVDEQNKFIRTVGEEIEKFDEAINKVQSKKKGAKK